MGADIVCACDRQTLSPTNKFNDKNLKSSEVVEKLFNNKFTTDQMLFSFVFDNTKIAVIKTENLNQFFNDRSSFKITNNREINCNYDSVKFCNFLNKHYMTIIVLQNSAAILNANSENTDTNNNRNTNIRKTKMRRFETNLNFKVDSIDINTVDNSDITSLLKSSFK